MIRRDENQPTSRLIAVLLTDSTYVLHMFHSEDMMTNIEQVRAVVADALTERDIGMPEFRRDIREGRRDDTPFMVGALAIARSLGPTPPAE